MAVAWVLKRTVMRGELSAADAGAAGVPAGRICATCALGLWERATIFLSRVGTHHPGADGRAVVPVELPRRRRRAPPDPPIQYSIAGMLGHALRVRVRADRLQLADLASRWCRASPRAKWPSARSAPSTRCRPPATMWPARWRRDRRTLEPGDRAVAAGLVRVRAAMPVDAGGGAARDQLVALSADHGGLPVRAGLRWRRS